MYNTEMNSFMKEACQRGAIIKKIGDRMLKPKFGHYRKMLCAFPVRQWSGVVKNALIADLEIL